MIFNNATSLPLLLLQALGKIGTLKSLVGDDEDMSEVLARGKVSRRAMSPGGGGIAESWCVDRSTC